MRTPLTPDPINRPSSARQPAAAARGGNPSEPLVGGPPQSPAAAGSSLVSLQRATDLQPRPGANTDDSPTIITPTRIAPPSDPDLALFAGGKLGQYELIDTVGTGGMAAVLRARDTELGRFVALKILPSQMARDPENVTRFKQEARAAAKLDHDNIARVFSCGEDRGLNFIAFELVDGDNLRTLIERRGTLPPEDCVRYMLQVAAGLGHAADRGVVHRDIKPSNIVVTPDGRAKIVDMGLARSLGSAGGSVNGGVTQSGVTLGTFDYISPEQAIDPRRADVRSDIYSLGCAFYHALTGRPPVPDGTAAMKLNAHQHKPVLDPRVLNPAVPDALAAILSRMMAKDPARRYQTPAELIAALTVIARGMHLAADGLPVDPTRQSADHAALSILPAPPRIPVGLVAGVAAIALAIVIVVAMSGPSREPVAPILSDLGTTGAGGKASPFGDLGQSGQPPSNTIPPPVAGDGTATSVDDFLRLLQEGAAEIKLINGKTYDLAASGQAAIYAGGPGKTVTITGPKAGEPPIIRVAAVPVDPSNPGGPRAGSLTFAGAKGVTLRGVRVDIADAAGVEPADHPAGVVVADVGLLELDECRFERDTDFKAAEAVGLIVTAREGPCELVAKNCFFGVRRGTEIRLSGRVWRADVTECMFAPHLAAFKLVAGEPGPSADVPPTDLKLTSCSFMLDHGAVIDATDGARADVSAGYCLFAAVPADPAAMATMTDPGDNHPVVLRCGGDKAAAIRFHGRPGMANVYYHTDPLALGRRTFTFTECKQQFAAASPVVDDEAVLAPQSPWAAADPVHDLTGDKPWKAFQLKTTLPAVRVRDKEVLVVGARWRKRADLLRVYEPWPPQTQEAVALPADKVWCPNPPPGVQGNPNYYDTLPAAIAALKPGDTLLIRHDGPLPVPETGLSGSKLNLTIRAFPGTTPILIPGPEMNRYDAGLFRLSEGKLTLEGLEFRLKARVKPGAVRSLAVVAVVAGSQCILRHCAVTMVEESSDAERLAAVVLTDPESEMRTGPGRGPEVKLENCLIRGRGRAVWVQKSRPFDLDVANTVTATFGPVIEIDPPDKAPAAGSTCQIRLDRVTSVLAGPLFDLQPGRADDGTKSPGWVPVEVETKRCVFVATEKAASPVAAIEGADPTALKSVFTWRHAGRANWYANFPPAAPFLTATPLEDAGLPKTLDADGWFALTGEKADESVGKVTFAAQIGTRKTVAITPDNVAAVAVDIPGASVEDAGAEVAKVAKPTTEEPSGEK
ncbi:serine/threonine-protein kinase [Fimbriiglobus ruber]|uniref:Serine/threonine protein kinase PrkC, regulator of stationary phase n=1 Tax=Fimbriiglobus ruber TaxID=1908690 RepID=A0A225EEK4_9BACT|nr:serine/threonine-protein kinase [Fimbriiglobus ruber]OWK46795.1 Serine/threonine protein kinase PrkC, regulator of stationary phase [Fimbriiglobus ruber]